jgi:hypothetical protein
MPAFADQLSMLLCKTLYTRPFQAQKRWKTKLYNESYCVKTSLIYLTYAQIQGN